jgi:HAMP domain-containing protein/ribosomal protein S27E
MSKKDLIKKILENLSEEELGELLGEEKEEEEQEESQKGFHEINKNHRRRGRGRNKKRAQKEEPDNIKTRNKRRLNKSKSKNDKGKPCRTMPMVIKKNRKNLFEQELKRLRQSMTPAEREEVERAKESDRKNKGNLLPMMKRNSTMVDVVCSDCGIEETVSASYVPPDASRYRCNDCSTTPRG